jgi:hypothetical protein
MVILRTLACDYDGTLASEDRLGPEALAALRKAREAGLRLVLVTGRTFFELTRVCEHLDLFDGVVAENGGVLYFPPTATIRALAPPRRRGSLPSWTAGASPTSSGTSSSGRRGATRPRSARCSPRPGRTSSSSTGRR